MMMTIIVHISRNKNIFSLWRMWTRKWRTRSLKKNPKPFAAQLNTSRNDIFFDWYLNGNWLKLSRRKKGRWKQSPSVPRNSLKYSQEMTNFSVTLWRGFCNVDPENFLMSLCSVRKGRAVGSCLWLWGSLWILYQLFHSTDSSCHQIFIYK